MQTSPDAPLFQSMQFLPPSRNGPETAELSPPSKSPPRLPADAPFRWMHFREWKEAIGRRFEMQARSGDCRTIGVVVDVALVGNPYDPDMELFLDDAGTPRRLDVVVGCCKFREVDQMPDASLL